jgi:hypothetical protein
VSRSAPCHRKPAPPPPRRRQASTRACGTRGRAGRYGSNVAAPFDGTGLCSVIWRSRPFWADPSARPVGRLELLRTQPVDDGDGAFDCRRHGRRDHIGGRQLSASRAHGRSGATLLCLTVCRLGSNLADMYGPYRCPECQEFGAHRSRTRGLERIAKLFTELRPYRCTECGWRAWCDVSGRELAPFHWPSPRALHWPALLDRILSWRARPSSRSRRALETRCETCGAPAVHQQREDTAAGGLVRLACRSCEHQWWMPERRATPR